MALNIKPISDFTDRAAWEILWRDYAPDTTEQNTDYLWARLHAPTSPVKGVCLLDAERTIGFVHFVIQETTSGSKPECYIQDLYVAPSDRGRGCGKTMLLWVKEQANAERWSRVTLKTRANNLVAQGFYDKYCQRRSPYVHYEVIDLGQ